MSEKSGRGSGPSPVSEARPGAPGGLWEFEGGPELVEEHGAVEGVALDGFEAGIADDAA